MNIETIKEYQEYAAQGVVTALTCPTHKYLNLLPREELEGLVLVCPLQDTWRLLGLADYRQLELKLAMAKTLKGNK